MKNFFRMIALAATAVGFCSCSSTNPDLTRNVAGNGSSPTYRVKTTAYSHHESDHVAYGRGSATGNALLHGKIRSAAADWSLFPMGTIFRIDGDPCTYVVDDYGRALVGTKTIDIYKPSMQEMRAWGARNVNIKVVRWGCYKQSLNILDDRTRHAHVRAMVASIRKKIGS